MKKQPLAIFGVQDASGKIALYPGVAALLEVLLMFLPAIPAYLWMWPNVQGTAQLIAQCLTYLYVLAGTLFIGLRRWSWGELGLNRKGLGLSLATGLVFLAGRMLVIQSIAWGGEPQRYSPAVLAWQVFYYFLLVGLVEELLFRGLVYQALDSWRGTRWAIWGSSFGFMLWHIFGQGPLIGAATFVLGLVFAVIRWRAGGIIGLIVLHGLWDLQAVLLVSESNAQVLSWGRPEISHLGWMVAGFAMMIAVPVYLWKLHPLVLVYRQKR